MILKKGFTLIELLVVIAIIALLLSILMPSLILVKRQAQGVVCQSNTRQFVMAWTLYAGANEGGIVGGTTSNEPWDNASWNYGWVKPPQEEDGIPVADADVTLENELRGIERGYLFPYTDNTGLYHCPGAREVVTDGGYRSYSITGFMNGEGAGPLYNPEHTASKVDQIVRTANKVVFFENRDPRTWNKGSWIFPKITPEGSTNCPGWGDPFFVWHGKSNSLGFADGHTEMHKWVDESTYELMEELESGAITSWWHRQPSDREDIDFIFKAYLPKI